MPDELSRYERHCRKVCKWCAEGVQRSAFVEGEHIGGVGPCTAPTLSDWAESESRRADAAEKKWVDTVKIAKHIIKRLADEYGVHLSEAWHDRVLAGEHDIPFPASLTGDTLDSLRRERDQLKAQLAGVRENVESMLDLGERVVLVGFPDIRGSVEKRDGDGSVVVKQDDGNTGYYPLIDLACEDCYEQGLRGVVLGGEKAR